MRAPAGVIWASAPLLSYAVIAAVHSFVTLRLAHGVLGTLALDVGLGSLLCAILFALGAVLLLHGSAGSRAYAAFLHAATGILFAVALMDSLGGRVDMGDMQRAFQAIALGGFLLSVAGIMLVKAPPAQAWVRARAAAAASSR